MSAQYMMKDFFKHCSISLKLLYHHNVIKALMNYPLQHRNSFISTLSIIYTYDCENYATDIAETCGMLFFDNCNRKKLG